MRETQRAVTQFGGLVVFFEFLRQLVYREAVSKHLPFHLTSPNAIDPVETFTAFLLSVLAGAQRFAHTSLLRAKVVDVALSKTTVDANDLAIDPLALRTHEKCNQASYVLRC